MDTSAHRHRPMRLLAVLSGGLSLVVALTAASFFSSRAAVAGTRAAAGARAAALGGTWGIAKEVPGTAALSKGGDAQLLSVSCGRAGSCSAGGSYADASGRHQVFVANET